MHCEQTEVKKFLSLWMKKDCTEGWNFLSVFLNLAKSNSKEIFWSLVELNERASMSGKFVALPCLCAFLVPRVWELIPKWVPLHTQDWHTTKATDIKMSLWLHRSILDPQTWSIQMLALASKCHERQKQSQCCVRKAARLKLLPPLASCAYSPLFQQKFKSWWRITCDSLCCFSRKSTAEANRRNIKRKQTTWKVQNGEAPTRPP